MHNDLPANHVGFGIPQTSTHLHNGHTPSESDGFPGDFFNSGFFWDQHYPNVLAGFTDPKFAPNGDPREALGTMWYHDHRFDFTAQNAYKGLVGFHLLFDNQDSGDETDPNPAAFRLPSGEFDVPLLFADKVFDSSGLLFFDLFNTDGILGDKFMVNGAIQPFFQVHPRKYRFRCVNAGPSRWYQMFLTDLKNLSSVIPMTLIANDGNLLPAPLTVQSFQVAVAERMDVIIDFSKFKPGTSIHLENRLEQTDGRGPTGNTLAAGRGNLVMRFDVALPVVPDPSRIPTTLRPLPSVNMNEVLTTRTWSFERQQGAWAINGRFFDVNRVDARPRQGTAEIWVLQNNSGGWMHPIHLHLEEHQILSRNGAAPPKFEKARKDVAELHHNETVQFFMRFRDWFGRYPLHCHNMVHEDHAMMTVWEVVP
jgi:FtsP/CotA-like multicopper oxidase with cupredoxin domain